MTEHPIIFSAPMIKAIQEDRKTQTRRLNGLADVNQHPDAWESVSIGPLGYKAKKSAQGKFGATFTSKVSGIAAGTIHICPAICPYGKPGDRLWVREAFRLRLDQDDKPPSQDWWKSGAFYCADGDQEPSGCGGGVGKKRSPIFMPRWASRINLEIVSVRVERVQDISEADCIAEGMESEEFLASQERYDSIMPRGESSGRPTLRGEFERGWNKINGAGSWEANPWAWRIEFRRVK